MNKLDKQVLKRIILENRDTEVTIPKSMLLDILSSDDDEVMVEYLYDQKSFRSNGNVTCVNSLLNTNSKSLSNTIVRVNALELKCILKDNNRITGSYKKLTEEYEYVLKMLRNKQPTLKSVTMTFN